MDSKLKLALRYLITILALSLVVLGGVALLDLHDFRVVLGVIAGMALGAPVLELTKKIPHLED